MHCYTILTYLVLLIATIIGVFARVGGIGVQSSVFSLIKPLKISFRAITDLHATSVLSFSNAK